MRKITQQAAKAFNNNENFSSSNTTVSTGNIKGESSTYLLLHGHQIARKQGNSLRFSMCGWATVTTRERLQAAGVTITQSKGEQMYRDEVIDPYSVYEIEQDGSLSFIKQNHYPY